MKKLSKTDPKVRARIIKILDEASAWEHVAMNYIHFVEHYDSGVSRKWSKPFAAKLNHAIGDVMEIAPPTKKAKAK